MNLRRVSVLHAAILALGLVGCAANSPSAVSTPSPSVACPYSGTEKIDIPGCAMYDGDKPMDSNYAYRARGTPAPKDQAILDRALVSARSSLQAIATPMPNSDQVKAALEAEGLTFVEVSGDPATEVQFWAEKEMNGCVFGEITPLAGLTIEDGGFVADGGCHAVSGH